MTTLSGYLTRDDDCRIAWRTDGDQAHPPLLLANSLGTNLGMWDAQIEQWAAHSYIIRYDMRGHGQSDTTPAGLSIETLARDAVAVLDHLDIERADFVGVSLGGMVGQWLGFSIPERFDHIVLANTSAYMGPAEGWNQRIALVESGGMQAIADAVIDRWFSPAFKATSGVEMERVARMLLKTDPVGYCAACTAIRDMDYREAVAAFAARALVIGGELDPATPPEHSHELAEKISRAQLLFLPAAHLSNIECPQDFTRIVSAFLETTVPRKIVWHGVV